MLDDDQLAVAPQALTRIHHLALGRRQNRVPCAARQVDAFAVFGLVKGDNNFALGWPRKFQRIVRGGNSGRSRSGRLLGDRGRNQRLRGLHRAGRSGLYRWRGRRGHGDGRGRSWTGGFGRAGGSSRYRWQGRDAQAPAHYRLGHRRLFRWNHPVHIANLNFVRVLDGVPARNIPVVLPRIQPNSDQRVAFLNRVIPGFPGVFHADGCAFWSGLGNRSLCSHHVACCFGRSFA